MTDHSCPRQIPKEETVRWLSVVGARPQFVKLAPFCQAIERHNAAGVGQQIDHSIVHTGQHYDGNMTDCFFEQMRIPQPDFNLEVGSGSPGKQLGSMLERLESVIATDRPTWIIVYGDTNSTLAGAMIAAQLGISLAHIEAGCRSYKPDMPEERNRVLADHLSQLLLVPSDHAAENLSREGIGTPNDPLPRRVVWIGDTMFDALIASLDNAEFHSRETLERFGLKDKEYYLLTLHRANNTESPEILERVLAVLQNLSLPVIFPVHPRTRKLLSGPGTHNPSSLHLVSPVGYQDMLALEKHAQAILTDSGGVQKEALYVHVPCVTLRQETEWPETVSLGANRLVGTDPDAILSALTLPFPGLDGLPSPFGDGHACENAVEQILQSA